tara:strand:+ start:5584 stop:6114 length:531 start_codon:yes stop_codon:yes gene_type:complete
MKDRFSTCLPFILRHEGGFSNHPNDPGGATYKGITLSTYKKAFGSDKTVEDLKQISIGELNKIYEVFYWEAANCVGLPRGIDLCLFDMAVNAGPSRAQKLLQEALHVKQDGKIGPITRSEAHRRDLLQTVDDYAEIRMRYYHSLKHKSDFIAGWMQRVSNTCKDAKTMIQSPYIIY